VTPRELLRRAFDGSHPALGCVVLFILALILTYIGAVLYMLIANWGGCGPGTGRPCVSLFSAVSPL